MIALAPPFASPKPHATSVRLLAVSMSRLTLWQPPEQMLCYL
jgi:hypothetical protein